MIVTDSLIYFIMIVTDSLFYFEEFLMLHSPISIQMTSCCICLSFNAHVEPRSAVSCVTFLNQRIVGKKNDAQVNGWRMNQSETLVRLSTVRKDLSVWRLFW